MSYNTVEECDAYVQAHYLVTDDAYDNWDSLPKEDKQILLNRAFEVLETLPYIGRKSSVTQPNAFPRYPQKEVPVEVKYAECEQAIAFSDEDATQTFNDYRKMIQYGIQSYHIGNFGETLLSYSKNGIEIQFGLSSEMAKRFLLPWLAGGYRIG